MSVAADYANLAQQLYIAYFGRPADTSGLQNMENALASLQAPDTDLASLAAAVAGNVALAGLIESLGSSAETASLYGSVGTPAQITAYVNAIYENLFDRQADTAGLAFWSAALTSGTIDTAGLALQIAAAAQGNTSSQGVLDAATVANKTAVAALFTADLSTAALAGAYSGTDAAAIARSLIDQITSTTTTAQYQNLVSTAVQSLIPNTGDTTTTAAYTLTTGIDHLSGGADINTFDAVLDNAAGITAGGAAATLNATDIIVGHGQSTLAITDDGLAGTMSIPAGAAISGITTLNISTLEAISGDFSGWSGLSTINVGNANGAVSITAPDSAAVTVHDTAGTVIMTGGTTLTASTNNSNEIIVYGGATTTTVNLTGGVYDDIIDLNAGTGTRNTISKVSITNAGVAGAYSYTTIDSDALTSLTLTDQATGVYVESMAGTRTLALTLDGDGPGYVSSTGSWLEDNTATTLNVSAIGSASSIYIQANSATSLRFSDSVNLSLTELIANDAGSVVITGAGAFSASLTGLRSTAAINASTASGAVTVTLQAAQSFTGGAGKDIVTISAAPTAPLKGGAAAGNEIILNNMASASEASLTEVQHFSTLGISGSTSAAFEMNGLGFTAYDVQGSGGDVTFSGVAAGSALTIRGNNAHLITLQNHDSNGLSDSDTVTLGSVTASGITVAGLTLEDGAVTPNGIGTVHLVSDAALSTDLNTLTTLTSNGVAQLYLEGNAATTIGTLADTGTGSLQIINSIGFAPVVIDHMGDADTLSLVGLTISDGSFLTMTVTNAFTDNALAELALNDNVSLSLAGDTRATGVTVAGVTDNADVSLVLDGTATTVVDTVTLGNGNDSVDISAAVAGAVSTISLGSGNDTVSLGSGLDKVTFAAHATAHDTVVTSNTAASFGTPTSAGQSAVSTVGLSVITGLTTGDTLVLAGVSASAAVDAASNLAGVAGNVEFAHGSYSASGATFNYDAAGADTLVTYGAAGHLVSVVLVGTDFTASLPTALTSNAIVLA